MASAPYQNLAFLTGAVYATAEDRCWGARPYRYLARLQSRAGHPMPDSFAGSYGDPSDPVVVTVVDGHLFRDENEFYPIDDVRFSIPASGAVMRFRLTSTGIVDALATTMSGGRETLLLKIASRP